MQRAMTGPKATAQAIKLTTAIPSSMARNFRAMDEGIAVVSFIVCAVPFGPVIALCIG
jgi:hypothetical protein